MSHQPKSLTSHICSLSALVFVAMCVGLLTIRSAWRTPSTATFDLLPDPEPTGRTKQDKASRDSAEAVTKPTLDIKKDEITDEGNAEVRASIPRVTKAAERTLTFHVPRDVVTYDCATDAQTGSNVCGGLAPEPSPMNWTNLPLVHACGTKLDQLGYKHHYMYYIHAMLLSPKLQELSGVTMKPTNKVFEADIVVCAESGAKTFWRQASKRNSSHKQKLLLVEHMDSGSVQTHLDVLQNESTLAVLKQYVWHGRGLRCKHPPSPIAGLHTELLAALGEAASTVPQGGPLSPAAANELLTARGCPSSGPAEIKGKVHAAIPFVWTVRQAKTFPKYSNLSTLKERSIDVAFLGNTYETEIKTKDPNKAYLQRHRPDMLAILNASAQRHGWNIVVQAGRLPMEEFYRILQNTKIFLSPLGLGEWSGKDEESILSGAVLVKPIAALLETTIQIFTPNVTCLDVRPDWLDLESTLLQALGDLPRLEKIRKRAHKTLQRFAGYGRAVNHTDLVAKYAKLVRLAAYGQEEAIPTKLV